MSGSPTPEKPEVPDASEATGARFNLDLWRRFWAIAKPYWFDRKSWKARILLAVMFCLLVGYTGFTVWINQETGEFTSALAAKDSSRFWASIARCVGLLIFSVPIYAFYYFVRDKLGIDWRKWLTHRFIDSYFNNRAFYQLAANDEIDNPDQRITDDINTFTQRSLYFSLIIFEQILQLVAFGGVLFFITPKLVLFLAIYAIVGTAITTFFFGQVLIGLNYYQLQREGDFRYRLVRVRENAESIALYRGEQQEVEQLKESFGAGYLNFNRLIRMQLRLNLFQYGYSALTAILPAVILSPQVLSGEMEIGRLAQATGAFAAILKAVSLIVDNFDALSRFAAGIDRLDTFAAALLVQTGGRHRIRSRISRGRNPSISLMNVTVMTPDMARALVADLSHTIKPKDHLLIVGPSGGGKSSLLRAIAGIWTAGRGYIQRPPPNQMLVLSQRSYMVIGTLRNQLFYPNLDNRKMTDNQLQKILEQVNLPELAQRVGGFNEQIEWTRTLSLGEQQRVAFARVLLAKPKFVMLDEATSALDIENEETLYELISNQGITIVSISHRPGTLKFHETVLELHEDKTWSIHKAKKFSFPGQ